MSEISFIGTGGSVATEARDNTSLLLEAGGLMLIDCPGSVVQKIKKMGRKPEEVNILLVTHIHPDHIYGLPSLVHSLMAEDREIILLGSKGSTDFCASLLDLFRLRRDKIGYRVKMYPLVGGGEFRWGDVLIRAMEVPHSPESLAYKFSFSDGKELFFSGDTPCLPSLLREMRGIDYVIHDCSAPERFFLQNPELRAMHTSALQLGRIAEEIGIKTLVPIHIFGELPFNDVEIWAEIRESFRGELILPRDFQTLSL